MTDLHWLGAGEIAAAYAARRLSPVELVEALLGRIARLDPLFNTFIRLDADFAMDAARQAEREIVAGRVRGPLHGVPVGVKDIFDVAGLPTTCNSRFLLDNVAAADAHVVAGLRAAGAILLGKTGTHEFALGGPSFDLPFPPPRNPWNRDHHPGGSSSGSGAGLAAGFFPLALGSDSGGSIRHPAAACGIVGLKPSFGLVSRAGVWPLSPTLDHAGPMARSAADVALLLDTIAGHDPANSGSTASTRHAFGRALGDGVRGLRVGFVRHFHETDLPTDPQVVAAVEQTGAVLAAEGAVVETVSLPSLGEFSEVLRVILGAEAARVHAQHLRSEGEKFGGLTRERLVSWQALTADEYLQAVERRLSLSAAVDEVLRDVDVLLTASALVPPCRIDDAAMLAATHPLQAWRPFNVTGHPAVSVMAGLSRTGLPLSAQLVGRAGEEAQLLRVAACLERSTGWHSRHPPLD